MAKTNIKARINLAKVFAPKEEGWSETVNITVDKTFDGYRFNQDSGVKEQVDVNAVSVFYGEVVKALCNSNSAISAFLSSKDHDAKLAIIPVLLSGASIELVREHDDEANEWLTTIGKITLTNDMLIRVNKALDSLFGF